MYHKLTLIISLNYTVCIFTMDIYNGYCYSLTGVNCSTQGADAKKKDTALSRGTNFHSADHDKPNTDVCDYWKRLLYFVY